MMMSTFSRRAARPVSVVMLWVWLELLCFCCGIRQKQLKAVVVSFLPVSFEFYPIVYPPTDEADTTYLLTQAQRSDGRSKMKKPQLEVCIVYVPRLSKLDQGGFMYQSMLHGDCCPFFLLAMHLWWVRKSHCICSWQDFVNARDYTGAIALLEFQRQAGMQCQCHGCR